MTPALYRLFSWEHSYFSGKVRAYLRYKQHFGGLGPGFEDILATQAIIQQVLVPATGESNVPQLQTPDGTWIEDSSRIIDFCERRHPEPAVAPSADRAPRQRLVAHLHLEDILPEEIETDAPLFVEGLGLDSIDAVEIVALLEHEYGIRVTEMETAKSAFASVGTLASFVTENRASPVDPVEAEG